MMRGRREERRGDGAGPTAQHYQMRQKMVSIGDDYWIENDRRERVFKVDGKALRVRQTLIFEDREGREQCKIQQRMLRVKDSMEIEDAGGKRAAMVKKALITPVRERWTVKVADGPDLEVQGNLLDHEYSIGEGFYFQEYPRDDRPLRGRWSALGSGRNTGLWTDRPSAGG